MKTLSTISLFIFGVVVVSVMTAGLIFSPNKNNNFGGNKVGVLVEDTINQLNASGKSLVLNMPEISKHNKQTDCWMLISGKVYDITSYFGSHPGGSGVMLATCGKDATDAYMTKDPYATSSNSSRRGHSSNAQNLLTDYYLGDLNQTIGSTNQNKNVGQNNSSTDPKATNPVVETKITPVVTPTPENSITLNMAEISTHNKQSDCWMLINGKVYDLTSYFGHHPGGNGTMAATCGTDATDAYMTKDPNATRAGSRSAHSSRAQSLLTDFYIGDFNQKINK